MVDKPFLIINKEYFEDYNAQSKLIVGNITIFLDKKFNWFNRLMFKLLFGLRLEKIGDNNVEDTNKD